MRVTSLWKERERRGAGRGRDGRDEQSTEEHVMRVLGFNQ